MIKAIFYEFIGVRIAGNLALWFRSKGYKKEADAIIEALANWASKEANRLKG